jgi:hypothetical protein
MKKVAGGCLALLLLSSSMTPASALMLPVAPVAPASSSSAGLGAWVAGGIIGVAAFLGIYDVTRRTTCSGDVFRLGGPGFTEPLGVGNVMVPQCSAAHKVKGQRG